jgi:stage II sporulation protein R
MLYKKKGDILTISMLIGASLTFLIASFASFARQCEQVSGEVLRLHVIANSDSAADQRLKYLTRDFIVNTTQELFTGALTLENAVQSAEGNLAELEKDVNDFIRSQGYDYDAEVSLVNMYFTTRTYENITMPAGNYEALRIIIGAGAGRNWWCVVFPPLCLPAVTPQSNTEAFFSADARGVIESGNGRRFEVRFAVYEWFTRLRR